MKRTHKLYLDLASKTMKRIHNIYPNLAVRNGHKTHELYPKLASENGKKYGSKGGKIAAISNKKNKTSAYFNKNLQIKNGKIGGLKSLTVRREFFPFIFMSCSFDSWKELEIAMCIYYQFNIKLKERRNCHILVGNKEFDFFINGCFIEYHPYNSWYKTNKIPEKDYYKIRRNVLNKNGYKDYKLIVIK